MSRRAQGILLLLIGLVAVRLVLSGTYDSYVQPGMRIPLLLASAFLIAVGVGTAFAAAWTADREHKAAVDDGPADRDDHGDDHQHDHQPKVGWLLVAPLAVLLLIAPAPLGADAASRQDSYVAPEPQGSVFPALDPPENGAVDLRVGEFIDRAYWDEARSLDGTPVRLRGFVVQNPEVDGDFVLARFRIACCAADAIPAKVVVAGDGTIPEQDTWVAVTGVLAPGIEPDLRANDFPPVTIDATDVTPIEEPANPYE